MANGEQSYENGVESMTVTIALDFPASDTKLRSPENSVEDTEVFIIIIIFINFIYLGR